MGIYTYIADKLSPNAYHDKEWEARRTAYSIRPLAD